MKLAIMQPYFLPYIGYFQLMNLVDDFVVYDNIQFTKRGWIHRNRILVNGSDEFITLPLKKGSDYLMINERHLADGFGDEANKILNRVRGAYSKAPYFDSTFSMLEDIMSFPGRNLFDFLLNSLLKIKAHLEIVTPLRPSSKIQMDHSLKSADRVIGICQALYMRDYVNPIGGKELYDRQYFNKSEIKISFLRAMELAYPQFDNKFVPNLSILDVLMFNNKASVKNILNQFTLE